MGWEVSVYPVLRQACVSNSSQCVRLMQLERQHRYSAARIWVREKRSELGKVCGRRYSLRLDMVLWQGLY